MLKNLINQFFRVVDGEDCVENITITNSDFPDDSEAAAWNYCRSPYGYKPWCMSYGVIGIDCYPCDIPICPG